MRGQNAILVGRTSPSHQFKRAQIGGEKTEAGDPGSHFASGHEEIFARIGPAFQIETNGQNQREVKHDDHHIDRGQMHEPGCLEQSDRCHHDSFLK